MAEANRISGFSVPLCTFNGERYLTEQLESIARQTSLPAELIACDDGSTDKTLSILRAFAERAPFPVRIVQNPTNYGVAQNLIRAIHECRGEWIALCDQDDVWLPLKLQRMREVFERSSRVTTIFTDGIIIDEHSRDTGERLSQRFGFADPTIQRRIKDDPLMVLTRTNICTGATMVLRADARPQMFPLPEDLPRDLVQDGWMALVAAATGGLAFVPEALTCYRSHPSQQLGVGAHAPNASSMQGLELPRRRNDWIPFQADRAAKIAAALRQRLGATAGTERASAIARHLQFRRSIRSVRRHCRLFPIVKETLAGGYRRESNSVLLSQLRDLTA